MGASEGRKELRGLARSIASLFDEDTGGAPRLREEEVVWEELEEETGGSEPVAPDPGALGHAVEAFLAATPLERDGLGQPVRRAAAALREVGDVDSLTDAVERLAGAPPEAEDEAAVAMARALLTPPVAARLGERLGEAREEARREELERVCTRLGTDMARSLAEALSGTTDRSARSAYVRTMHAMGDTALPVVEELVEDPRWFVVRNAVAVAGEIGGSHALELVIGTLANPDARVRREAVVALAKLGGEDAGVLACGMLEDSDAEVRLAAARATGGLRVQKAVKPLLAILDREREEEVVASVLGALGRIGDTAAVPALEKKAVRRLLSRPPVSVRIAAYRALSAIGTPHARSLLVRAADDRDPDVKEAVRGLLGMR